MSELKTRGVDDVYIEYYNTGKHELAQVYLKSEADAILSEKDKTIADAVKIMKEQEHEIAEKDKEIAELREQVHDYALGLYVMQARAEKEARHQKYKRCLLRSVISEMNATHFKDLFYGAGSEALADEYNKQITIHYKWQKRWLALANKFKLNRE